MAGISQTSILTGEPVVMGEPVEDSPHGKFRRELIFPENTQIELEKISRDLQHDTKVIKELRERIDAIHKPKKDVEFSKTMATIVAVVAGALALFLLMKYRTWRP